MALSRRSPKQIVLAGIAVAALLAGGTIAVIAATGGHDGGHAGAGTRAPRAGRAARLGGRSDLAAAARYLGLPVAQLRGQLRSGKSLSSVASSTGGKSTSGLVDAVVAARTANLAAAVAAGALSPDEQRAALAGIRDRVARRVNRAGGYGPPLGGVVATDLRTAARYLGVSPEKLRTDLQSGRTLARVADAKRGKSASGLHAAILGQRKARLEAAVAAGRLSKARQRKLLAELDRRITVELNGGKRTERAPKG
jgi:hypothetical protein